MRRGIPWVRAIQISARTARTPYDPGLMAELVPRPSVESHEPMVNARELLAYAFRDLPARRTSATLHPFNLRMLAEELTRIRRPDDRERYAAAQRQAKIDPNPHQIDDVIFALRRIREGGCILADEVGLTSVDNQLVL